MMPLTNCRILAVEDEYMVAQELLVALEEAGAFVIGPESSVASALTRIHQGAVIHAVVLDVNLGGESAFPVADELMARAIPFVFASGYEDKALTGRYPGVVNCAKPFRFRNLERSLVSLLKRA